MESNEWNWKVMRWKLPEPWYLVRGTRGIYRFGASPSRDRCPIMIPRWIDLFFPPWPWKWCLCGLICSFHLGLHLGVDPLLDVDPKFKNGNGIIPELALNDKKKWNMEIWLLKWNEMKREDMKWYLWHVWNEFSLKMLENVLWSKTMFCKDETFLMKKW